MSFSDLVIVLIRKRFYSGACIVIRLSLLNVSKL